MKNSHKAILLVLLAISATACIKNGFDSDNCPGEFTFIPVYPEGIATTPGDMNTIITGPDGSRKPVNIGENNPVELEEGKNTITTTQGSTDNTIIDSNRITIKLTPDGTPQEPGDFSGGYVDVLVDPNTDSEDTQFQVPVNKQTRPLVIKVKFVGNNVLLIEKISGEVSGIAFSRDLNNGFPPVDGKPRHPAYTSGNIAYSFSKTEGGSGKEFLSEAHRLLGIDGNAEQHLTLDILFKDQVHKKYDFDITRTMDEFHIIEVTKPWMIEITIYLGADFSATIEDWKAGPDIWLDAEHY